MLQFSTSRVISGRKLNLKLLLNHIVFWSTVKKFTVILTVNYSEKKNKKTDCFYTKTVFNKINFFFLLLL